MDRIRKLKNIILLGIVYYLILGPIALFLKLFRVKPLGPKGRGGTSFWEDRKEQNSQETRDKIQ